MIFIAQTAGMLADPFALFGWLIAGWVAKPWWKAACVVAIWVAFVKVVLLAAFGA